MKFIKFLLGLIITLLVLVLLSAVVILILVTDYSVVQPDYLHDNIEFTVGENLVSKALDTTGTDENINFTLSEKEVNILLKSLVFETNESLKETPVQIDTAFVTLKDEKNISFKAYFSLYGLKSSLSGDFSYTLGKSSLIFRIDKITLAKITMNYNLLNNFNVNKEEIEDIINPKVENLGLKLHFEEDVLTVYVNQEMYEKLFTEHFKDINNPILTNVLFNSMEFKLDKDLIGLNVNINSYIIDPMKDFTTNLGVDFSYYCGQLNDLLVDNVIELSNVDKVGNYLINGYSSLNDEDKSFINALDLSSIGIFENASYKGAKDYTESNLTEVLVSQIPSMRDRLYISELEINQNLMQNDFVGTISFFAREEDNKYILNYIAIDSIYVDIRDRELDLYFIIDINGAKLSVKLINFLEASNNLSVIFDINELKIGSVSMEEDIKLDIVNYLSTSLDYDWLEIESNQKIKFDFSKMFNGNEYLDNLQNVSTKTYILLSGNKNNGQLEFVFE